MYRVYRFEHHHPVLFTESSDKKKVLATMDALVNDLEERIAVTYHEGKLISLMYMNKDVVR